MDRDSQQFQKMFQEAVQALATIMIPETRAGRPVGPTIMGRGIEGKEVENPYGPVVLEQLDRMRSIICAAEETVERLYEKTKMVTYPEPANQVSTGGGEVEQVFPPVAEELRESCRRVERMAGRINFLIARIGL